MPAILVAVLTYMAPAHFTSQYQARYQEAVLCASADVSWVERVKETPNGSLDEEWLVFCQWEPENLSSR